ncbi:glycoside hydrolase family 16 protein [Novosphingobium sp. BL-8H]
MLQLTSGLMLGLSMLALLLVLAPDLTRAPAADQPVNPPLPTPLPIDRRHPSFAEEFDQLRLQGQGGPWRTRFDYAGIAAYTLASNGEKQLYVDRDFRGTASSPLGLNPFNIAKGMLTITAAPVTDAQAGKMWGYRYASGLLTTRHSFAQRYGYFEIRARLTDRASLWPAFWLLPADGSWPPEIDVFEQLGRDPATITMSTVSNATTSGQKRPVHTHAVATLPTAASAFHTYGLLWTPEQIAFYLDDREISRMPTPADMHTPMYLLVNLAVGGPWAHDPAPDHPVNGTITVDYIRVYPLISEDNPINSCKHRQSEQS